MFTDQAAKLSSLVLPLKGGLWVQLQTLTLTHPRWKEEAKKTQGFEVPITCNNTLTELAIRHFT